MGFTILSLERKTIILLPLFSCCRLAACHAVRRCLRWRRRDVTWQVIRRYLQPIAGATLHLRVVSPGFLTVIAIIGRCGWRCRLHIHWRRYALHIDRWWRIVDWRRRIVRRPIVSRAPHRHADTDTYHNTRKTSATDKHAAHG